MSDRTMPPIPAKLVGDNELEFTDALKVYDLFNCLNIFQKMSKKRHIRDTTCIKDILNLFSLTTCNYRSH